MEKLVCVDDFEKAARSLLNKNALEYFATGADDEITLNENKRAFKRWLIIPRVLIDVSKRDLTTTILGRKIDFPIGVSPSAMQKLAHTHGEVGIARAAASLNTIYTLSSISTFSIEEVAAASPGGPKWFQLYVYKDRRVSENLVRRAEAAGYEALVLTVDLPLVGKRRSNLRNEFKMPEHLRRANFEEREGSGNSEHLTEAKLSGKDLANYINHLTDATLTWEDVAWLKRITRLPIIVKGIMTGEDAKLAVKHGVAGVFVSNHGGRQLDTVNATIDVLEEIVKAVGGACEVYLDGGISTGSDVFKALALGADMVFAGRPFLWGLAVGGEDGAKKVLQILRDELDLTMALAGTPTLESISRKIVARKSHL